MAKKVTILLLASLLLFWHWFDPAARKNQKGIAEYEQRRFAEALQSFLSARGLKPDEAQLKSNTAATLYQLKKFQEALSEFSGIDPEKSGIPRAEFYYNLGNTHFRLQQYDQALDDYKKSLLANPEDIEAKKNLEWTLKKIEEGRSQTQPNRESENQAQESQQKIKQESDYQPIMQFLDQNEKNQLGKKKRKFAVLGRDKDW